MKTHNIKEINSMPSAARRFNKKLIWFIIMLVCGAVFAVGTSWADKTNVTLVLSNPNLNSTMAPFFVARELGYWKSEGVDVEIQFSKGTSYTLQLLASGKVHIGQSNEIQLMISRNKGLPLKVVMPIQREFGSRLAVLANSPITKIEQLKGKNIGVASLSAAQVPFVKAMLATSGLDPAKDNQIVAVGWGAQALAALLKDKVAAVAFWPAQFLAWEVADHKFRYFPADFFPNDVPGYNLVSHEDFIQGKEDTLIGILRGVAKGYLFSITNPEAAVRIYYKANPTKKPVGENSSEVTKKNVDLLAKQLKTCSIADRKIKKWGANYKPGWEAVRDFYLSQGTLKEKRDVEEYYVSPRITDRINDFDSGAIVKAARDYK
jgi:NitT/TauT family transport system substrate-binding protein